MKTIVSGLLLSLAAVLFSCQKTDRGNEFRLWYTTPAHVSEESVPLGNGRLGAMPDGGVFRENIALNDIAMWAGGMGDIRNPEALRCLPEIRKLLMEGKNEQAQQLMSLHFVYGGMESGRTSGLSVPGGSFRMLGNLHLDYFYRDSAGSEPVDYERGLSLNDAVAWTHFKIGNVKYKREYFVSYADDVMVIKLTADKKGKLNFDILLDRPENFSCYSNDGVVHMVGRLSNGTEGKSVRYMAQMKVILENGIQLADSAEIHVNGATTAYVLLSAGTDLLDNNYENTVTNLLEKALVLDFETLKNRHIAVWQEKISQVELNPAKDREDVAADVRPENFQKQDDLSLYALYRQIGRCLMPGGSCGDALSLN